MGSSFNSLLEFICDYTDKDVDITTIDNDSQLISDLGFNSLTLLDMINGAEEVFGISIADEEVTEIITVGDVIALLRGKGVTD